MNETRTEYAVLYTIGGEGVVLHHPTALHWEVDKLAVCEKSAEWINASDEIAYVRVTDAHVVSRQVTTTPWVDVDADDSAVADTPKPQSRKRTRARNTSRGES